MNGQDSRWESNHGNDDEWLMLELANPASVHQLKIYWETASAKEYEVQFSMNGEEWTTVFRGSFSAGQDRTDTVVPNESMQAKYIRIQGISRTTVYGYSIYEVELYHL